jgi:AcrR family transcriptional regulator
VARARVARGTFYLYFESKRAIFEELVDDLLRQLRGAVRRIGVGEGDPPPIDQLRATVERVLDVVAEHRDLTRLLMHEAVGLDEDFDTKLRDFYDSIVVLIRGALDLGQSLGLVCPCDSALVAYCVLGSFKELVYQLLIVRDPLAFDRKAVVRAVVDYNLRGVFR